MDSRDRLIARINALPVEALRFSLLGSLKVGGFDELSPLTWDELALELSDLDRARIERAFEPGKWRDRCARWVLRGLEPTRAIRKTEVDREIVAEHAPVVSARPQRSKPKAGKAASASVVSLDEYRRRLASAAR